MLLLSNHIASARAGRAEVSLVREQLRRARVFVFADWGARTLMSHLSALYGKVSGTEFGIVVTLGSFTTQARQFSERKANLRLIDGDDLVSIVLNHYESLDARYQGLIPLKRIYIPEPVEEVD